MLRGALPCAIVLIRCHRLLAEVSAHALQEAREHTEYPAGQMHEKWITDVGFSQAQSLSDRLSTAHASAYQDTLHVLWLAAKHELKPWQGASDNIWAPLHTSRLHTLLLRHADKLEVVQADLSLSWPGMSRKSWLPTHGLSPPSSASLAVKYEVRNFKLKCCPHLDVLCADEIVLNCTGITIWLFHACQGHE